MLKEASQSIDTRTSPQRRRRLGTAMGVGIVVPTVLALAACSGLGSSSVDGSAAKPDTSASGPVSPAKGNNPPERASATTSPSHFTTQELCSPSDKPHELTSEPDGSWVDNASAEGLRVTFSGDDRYSDSNFPGESVKAVENFTNESPTYLRVASIQDKPASEAGGLIDVTKQAQKLETAHPITGVKPGDEYTVFLGGGPSANGTMEARRYTVSTFIKGVIDVYFNGCSELGPSLPIYRNGTPQT